MALFFPFAVDKMAEEAVEVELDELGTTLVLL